MSISLLHHEPTALELPCILSNDICHCHAFTRNISMGGVWVKIEEDDFCLLDSKDNLGECHIELDGYRIDIPCHFTRVFNDEFLVEFLTLTIEQKVILGFIINKQHACKIDNSVGNARF
ncbi:hypothetical protein TDB9533_00439 [Thalassocella blandensis]|nr:hypothetical protein TDB9533_00439 [Thalassocella blandensis]